MTGNFVFFDPQKSFQLGKFQGSMAGAQAGHAAYIGTAYAPTTIFNQGGFYALQDTQTGYVHLNKLHNDSMYTQNWYDQNTKTVFDVKDTNQQSFTLSQLSNNMTAQQIAALDN